MNNLKRVLSLALSGIMLVGMMAMGASAADFTDADTIEHDDAVNVLVALNVINGQDDGSFNPKGDVTRGQMAKMIAVAMNGGSETNTGVKTSPTFTDIKGHWAENYIEYCSDLGIISGRGDGTFDPDGNVTGLEATKMVLTALGYDATAYRLTGASWAVRTDELARAANPSIYDELAGIVMSNKASRDTAAQLIWNGLQNETRKVTPDTNTSTGEVTWQYVPGGQTMLKARYGADVWVGTYEGNSDSLSGVDSGCIRIKNAGDINASEASRTASVVVTSDVGIENIGEEVKVVYRDVTGGTANRPDKRDTVYGVFNTGKTEVYNITKSDLQDAGSSDKAKKVKFGDTKYDAAGSTINVVTNYVGAGTATAVSAFTDTLRDKTVDLIKFVCDNDGKITDAYITEVEAGRVTAVSSSKVTVSGIGSIDIADNDVYDGIAKDDVVVYTRYYSNTDKDDAFFTITKAESVQGEMTGYKLDSGKYINVVVDGTSYNICGEPTNVGNTLSDDAVDRPGTDNSIGDTVELYMAGGKVVGIKALEKTGGNYALITDSDAATGNKIGSSLNAYRVTLLLPDGTKVTRPIHKDSTHDGATKVVAGTDEGKFVEGVLVEYTTLSSDSIKIKNVVTADLSAIGTTDRLNGTGTVTVAAGGTVSVPAKTTIWNKDTKALTYNGATSVVAASNATLFVKVGTDYFAYNLRDLGAFGFEDTTGSGSSNSVAVFMNKDGLVASAYVTLAAKPGSNSADTLYGIVTSYNGTRKLSDDTYYEYKVAVDRDEDLTVYVDVSSAISKGDIVKFDEKNDQKYEGADFIKFAATANNTERMSAPIAVKDYNASSNLLTYFNGTHRDDANKGFEGTGLVGTLTVADDVKVFYVNQDGDKAGDEVGVNTFAADTGYANAVYHLNSDAVVDVIVVETSNKANIVNGATGFGVKNSVSLTAAAMTGTNAANYAISVPSSAEPGAQFTVTVTCNSIAADTTETVTVTYNGNNYTLTFSATGTQTLNLSAVTGQTTVTSVVR